MKGQLMQDKSSIQDKRSAGEPRSGAEPNNVPSYTAPEIGKGSAGTKPTPQEQAAPKTRWFGVYFAVLVASVFSGLLLSLCYFPFSLGGLAWVALVPLLILVRTRVRPFWVYLCAFAGGSTFFWIALSWMPYSNEFMQLAWYVLSVYCSLYAVVAVGLIRLLDRRTRLPLLLSVPLVWVGLEYIRAFLLTGFPWYFLGHTQHIFLPIIQIADLGGAYTVSFLVAMVNALVFEWLYLSARFRAFFRMQEPAAWVRILLPSWLRWQSVLVGGMVVLALWYGFWRMSQTQFLEGPRVAILQGNIDQNIRNQTIATPDQVRKEVEAANKKIGEEYGTLCLYSVTKGRELLGEIDLIIWPETSFPGFWPEIRKGVNPLEAPPQWAQSFFEKRQKMRELATDFAKTNMLIGINTWELVDPKMPTMAEKFVDFNSALLVYANGTTGGRYDKIHRIPFGEYVPLRDELPWIKSFTPYTEGLYDIKAGKEMKRFKLGKYHFGVLTCFEDSDPFMARQYGVEQEDGPPVDFLINISNDGWYAGTSQHNEHLAIARFRAVETRKALARSVNMGISAVIDPNGKVIQPKLVGTGDGNTYWHVEEPVGREINMPIQQWNHFKKRPGVLTAAIPIDNRTTLYCLWGDWFVYLCWTLVILGIIWAMLPGKKLRPVM